MKQNPELEERRKRANRYYDMLRAVVDAADYSVYPFPDIVYNSQVEKIEASRRLELERLEKEYATDKA